MDSIRSTFLLFIASIIITTSAVAQNYPFPASTPNTDVLCSLCPGRTTLLTIGYPPNLRFVGRWSDAESARDYQQNFRTARPELARVVPDRNRIYTILGSALAVYDTNRFFSRLNARPQEAMVAETSVIQDVRNQEFGPPEVFLWWDTFFYAESERSWQTPFQDGQDRLYDFDWDDRGNVYLAYSKFGWGIVKDSGEMGGRLPSVSQTLGPTPDHILALKTSDGKYYTAISDKSSPSLLQIWDVQNASAPVKQPDITGRSFMLWAKGVTGSRVGIVEYTGGLSIFTSDAFVRTGTPIIRFDAGGGGTFRMITSDGTNFYAYGASGIGPFIDVISPSGNTYVETRYPTNGYGLPQGMHYGDGYLAIYGVELMPVGTWNIRVYKVGAGTLTEIPFEMPVPGNPGAQKPFWSMYYSANAPSGYTHPNINNFLDATPVKNGSHVYLILSAYGLGDVWELNPGPPPQPTAPDPVIVKSGCLTVGSPCSFTVISAASQALTGWTFAWTVNPAASNAGTSASSFQPQFTTTADYTVGVAATNNLGSKSTSITGHIDQPLACSSAPNDLNAAIGPFVNGVPSPGDAVPFRVFPTGWTPSAACDKFAWSFGDGGTSTDMFPTHVFAAAGTYAVKLTLTGALSTGNYSTSVTIAGSTGCGTMTTSNVYVLFNGSGCDAISGDCSGASDVVFRVGATGYDLTCGPPTYSWDFGDGSHSSDAAPSHRYATDGNYAVKVRVSNGAQTIDLAAARPVSVVGSAPPPPAVNRRRRGNS